VTGGRRPPLVFDDPFITLDDDRARRAVELLREIARDFQVIYLTTSDRYHDAADAVVELEGPTERDDASLDSDEVAPDLEPVGAADR
jgi:DNA repair exonuclease SbcCD ATPase subunit